MSQSSYRESAAEDRSLVVADIAGTLIAHDVRTGERRWRRELGNGASRAVVHRGRVFVVVDNLGLWVLDYATGKTLRDHQGLASWKGVPTLLVDGERVFVASAGELFCFDVEGELLWHDPYRGCGTSSVGVAVPGANASADHRG